MGINQQIEELTDQYLRGDLSGSELRSFEDLIASDPLVKEHVGFQQNLVQGLVDHRKMQLKSRLDAIQVGTGSLASGIVSEGMVKVVGGAVVATIIGTGIYFMLPDSDYQFPTQEKVEIVLNESAEVTDEGDIPAMPLPQISEESDMDRRVKSSAESKVATIQKKIGEDLTEDKPANTNVTDEKPSDFIPKVSVPELSEISDEKEFISKDISIPEASDNDIVGEKDLDPVDIKTFNRKSTEIRYRYFEGKLSLYGDFKKEPYEILEINSKAARQIYLYYADQYYKVEMSDDIKTLTPIKSQKLIGELKIIRDNKLN